MLLGVVELVVDAQNDRDVGIGGGSRDDDLLGAGVEVRLNLLAAAEYTRRLKHHVNAQLLPGQISRVLLGEDRELLTAGDDVVAVDLDLAREPSLNRVVLK